MKKYKAILEKEWGNFKGSEKGVFLIYGILVLSWSFFPLYKELGGGPIWWLFFSVIICGNFSNSVFVSERLNGSMEILLTSGFSRTTVFFGKIAFIVIMSAVIGILCFSFSLIWLSILGHGHEMTSLGIVSDAVLFILGVLLNAAFGAWLSFRLQSPRIIPFMTIMLMGFIVACYYGLSFAFGITHWALSLILAVVTGVFGLLAKKEFDGEKIIQPIHL